MLATVHYQEALWQRRKVIALELDLCSLGCSCFSTYFILAYDLSLTYGFTFENSGITTLPTPEVVVRMKRDDAFKGLTLSVGNACSFDGDG